jgi:hypothetical protein
MPNNIGAANYAAYQGIPATTVTWTGRSGTSRAGTIFTSIEISNLTDDSDTRDNQGEIQAERARNDRLQYRFSVKPVAANAAAALAIAGDLPKKKSIVTITSDAAETDISVAGTILVQEASKSLTPEGEAIVNLTVIKHVGKTFAALS